jgi:hypothetical protein
LCAVMSGIIFFMVGNDVPSVHAQIVHMRTSRTLVPTCLLPRNYVFVLELAEPPFLFQCRQ